MIIGFNFYNLEEGCVYDSPVCTDDHDELELGQGIYDQVYVTLDKDSPSGVAKPQNWTNKTIMNAQFKGNLEAGSITAEGFRVTHIMMYRTVFGLNEWDAIGRFEYDEDLNYYSYTDRYVKNGTVYQYAVVPVSNHILGDRLESDLVESSYEGIFITDRLQNRRLDYDVNLGEVIHNTNMGISNPVNGRYPIVSFGNSNYRSGALSVLPLSRETIGYYGEKIDAMAEQVTRQAWLDFINNGKAKVLRLSNGVIMLIATHETSTVHRENLTDLADLSFSYIEIGELDFQTLVNNDLVSDAYGTKLVYDDFGGEVFEHR